MDDLELLRGFRADLPDVSHDHLAALRGAYRGVPAPPRRAHRRRVRRGAVLAAAAAVAAALLLAVTLTGGDQNAAAAALRSAAARLDAEPATALPAGSYWYVRTRERQLGEWSYRSRGQERHVAAVSNDVDETWVANDGSGGGYSVQSGPFALTAAARRALGKLGKVRPRPSRAQGILEQGPNLAETLVLGTRTLTPGNLSALPTGEPALRRMILAAPRRGLPAMSRARIAWTEFEAVTNALFALPFEPHVTARLYRLLAQIPGVQREGTATDALGRRGIAIALDFDGTRHSVIIDPSNGRPLERSDRELGRTVVVIDPSNGNVIGTGGLGSVTWRQTIVSTGIVPGLAIRPDGTRLDTARWTVCKPDPKPGSPYQAHCTEPTP